jgi:hypothetical protein
MLVASWWMLVASWWMLVASWWMLMWVTACPYWGFNVDNFFLDIDVGELAEPCLGADVASLFLDID